MQIVRSILLLFIFDAIILVVSPIIACNFSDFYAYSILNLFLGLAILYLKDNYKIESVSFSFKKGYLLLEGLIFLNIILFWVKLIFTKNILFSVNFCLKNLFISFLLLLFGRIFICIYQKFFEKRRNVLIFGANNRARAIIDVIKNNLSLKMSVVGVVKEGIEDVDIREKVFDNPSEIFSIIRDNDVKVVILTNETKYLLDIPKNVQCFKMTDLYEKITGKYYIDAENVEELFWYISSHKSKIYNISKRIFDLISSFIILVVTLPITLFVSLGVFGADKHSPFFSQRRVTKNKKIFNAYKLRTMYLNKYVPTSDNLDKAENQSEDSRVIPFCKFVRKARFDELPQMINILKGEMSIVGPRAEWDELVKVYEKDIPYHNCRHWVKTAWTGWAQINQGHCFAGNNEQIKLEYDLYYIKHRKLIWEIGILIKAVFMALGGRHG